MKITVIQQDIAWKNVPANIKRIEKLVANAERSMSEIEVGDRAYTYSEFGRLMKKLKGLER